MKEQGISSQKIELLREADWEMFKSERRYLEKARLVNTYIEKLATEKSAEEIYTVTDLLDQIENKNYMKRLKEKIKKLNKMPKFNG